MDKNFLERQYESELNQRNTIYSAINIPILGLGLVATAITSMILGFDFEGSWWIKFFFLFFVGACVFFALKSLHSIYKCLVYSKSYEKMPECSAMFLYKESLKKHYEKYNSERQNESDKINVIDYSNNAFDSYTIKKLIKCIDINSSNNIKRFDLLFESSKNLFFAIAAVILSGCLFAYSKSTKPEQIHKIQIVSTALQSER